MIELINELREIQEALQSATKFANDLAYQSTLNSLLKNIEKIENASCGSWFGYRANVYYKDFDSPSMGMYSSHNWQHEVKPTSESPEEKNWQRYSEAQVKSAIEDGIEKRDIRKAIDESMTWIGIFEDKKDDVLGIVRIAQEDHAPLFDNLAESIQELRVQTVDEIVETKKPAQMTTDDLVAKQQGIRTPPHIQYHAKVLWSMGAARSVIDLARLVKKTIAQMERNYIRDTAPQSSVMVNRHEGLHRSRERQKLVAVEKFSKRETLFTHYSIRGRTRSRQ